MEAYTDSAITAPREAEARLIVRTSGVCGGKPRIDGTRIKVQHVAIWYERQGMSPDEIVRQWPHLSLADVHAALAYYYSHRLEIERDIKEGREFAEKLQANQPSILEQAQQQRAGDDPLSHG